MNVPLSKMAPYMAGGVGLALLENQILGNNLPEPLKKINWGLGATTGAMMADPATRATALSTLPLKQIGLFGVAGLDRFRQQQQSLVDTNLQTAKINQRTARIQGHDAGGRKALLAAMLIPAGVASGALTYGAYDKYKKNHRPSNRYGTVDSKGNPPAHQKVRIDIPPSALPRSFFDSMVGLGNNPRAYEQLKEQGAPPVNRKRLKAASLRKSAYGIDEQTQAPPRRGRLGTLGNLGYEFTGIPSIMRGISDAGKAFSNTEQGNFKPALRYGLGTLGGAAVGLASLHGGMPFLGRMLGKARLGGVIGRDAGLLRGGLRANMTEMPTLAKPLFRAAYGNELNPRLAVDGSVLQSAADRLRTRAGIASGQSVAERVAHRQQILKTLNPQRVAAGQMPLPDTWATDAGRLPNSWATAGPLDRLRNMKNRYDSTHLAWDNPNSPWWSPSSPATRGTPPPMSLPGQLFNAGRYGVNRAMDTAYRGKQFLMRHPNATLGLAGAPLSMMGTDKDNRDMADAREQLRGYVPDYIRNQGPNGMPISSALAGLMRGVGGPDTTQGTRDQISGTPHSPFNWGRAVSMIL